MATCNILLVLNLTLTFNIMAYKISTTKAVREVMSKTPNKIWSSRAIQSAIFDTYGKKEQLDTVRRVLCRLTNELQNENGWIVKLGENEYMFNEPSPTLEWMFGGLSSKVNTPSTTTATHLTNTELIDELKRRLF